MNNQSPVSLLLQHASQARQQHVPEKLLISVCLGIMGLALIISGLNLQFLKNLIGGPLGVFSNLAFLTYFAASLLTARTLAANLLRDIENEARLAEIWKPYAQKAGLFVVCLVLAGESVGWLQTFYAEPVAPETFAARSLRDLLAAAYSQTPGKLDLDAALLIGGTRLALLAGVIYGAGYAIYKKKEGLEWVSQPANRLTFLYGSIMLVCLLITVSAHMMGKGWMVFESGADLCTALSLLAIALFQLHISNHQK